MFKKITIVVLLLFTFHSCSSRKTVEKNIPVDEARESQKITQATLLDGTVIVFDENGGKLDQEKDLISGVSAEGEPVSVKVDQVLTVQVVTKKGLSTAAKIGIVAGIVGAVVIIVAATKESCPFVYSYNGEQYVFDAEPLGGAITQGMQKTEVSRLEHIAPVEGEYRLLFRNEVNETQYTDRVRLLIVDHDSETRVVPDPHGSLHALTDVSSPISARDEHGKDISRFVHRRDDVAWQTKLPRNASYRGGDLRHHLTFEFAKPPNAKKAHLIINAGTALWGSHMIRAMLELRGNAVDAWYAGFNQGGPQVQELMQFIEREELYLLKVHVREPGGWTQQGYIPAGGPFIIEDKVIDLDLSNVPGDTLTLRFDPPMGFWSIDEVSISYYEAPLVEPQSVSLSSAVDQHGTDVIDVLSAIDRQYQHLSEVGEWMKISFDVPPQPEKTTRSVFLQTTGYYELHLSKQGPEQTALIEKLLTTPGAIVEYAMDQYLQHGTQLAESAGFSPVN